MFFTAPKNKNTKTVKENVFYTCDDDKNEKKNIFFINKLPKIR